MLEKKENETKKNDAREIADMLHNLSATERCTLRGIIMGVDLANKQREIEKNAREAVKLS